eukprot:7685380-Pyramimonas_sp.AAC.1
MRASMRPRARRRAFDRASLLRWARSKTQTQNLSQNGHGFTSTPKNNNTYNVCTPFQATIGRQLDVPQAALALYTLH